MSAYIKKLLGRKDTQQQIDILRTVITDFKQQSEKKRGVYN